MTVLVLNCSDLDWNRTSDKSINCIKTVSLRLKLTFTITKVKSKHLHLFKTSLQSILGRMGKLELSVKFHRARTSKC